MSYISSPSTFTNFAMKNFVSADADTTLTKEDSGAIVKIDAAVDVTLPAASEGEGLIFTFIVGDGTVAMNVKPASGDGINGVINDGTDTGALVSYDGTDDSYLASAAATNNVGDRVTLISDGVADWWILAGAGVWTHTA